MGREPLARRVQVAVGVLAPIALIALGLASRLPDALAPMPGAAIRVTPPTTAAAATAAPVLLAALPTPRAATVKVYVSGMVASPGVYELAVGDRVEDALRLAGGALEGADLTRLNLAQRVRDEQQIHVPRQPDPAAPTIDGRSTDGGEEPIDLNRATLEQLDRLPGIGPVTARRIVDYRAQHGPFASAEELRTLKLVTAATWEKIKDRVTAR